jgi:dienelactone hydrolase
MQPMLDAAGITTSPDAGGTSQPMTSSLDAALDASDAAALSEASVGNSGDAQLEAAAATSDSGSPYPTVSDVNVKGPYSSMTVSNTGPGGAYTVFRPSELAPNGVLNPIVAWGNGGATTPVDYPQLPHLASHGFVVVASNNPLVNGQQVRAGVDWIVQQNEASASPYYKKLDVKRIAGVGYSNGGLAQLETADDPRYLTVVIISGGNISEELRTQNMPKLHTPIAYLCTADDASKGNCAADFAVVKQPAFFGVMNGTGHTDVTTFLNIGVDSAIKRSAAATTAWLRWQVMSDVSYKAWFVGSACTLCKDSAWTVQQKALQ